MDAQFVEDGLRLFFGAALVIAIVVVLIVAVLAFSIGRWTAPTPEKAAREQARQEAIQSLTPQQKEALGL